MPLPNGLVNWSFSVLEMYKNCPYKYWAVKVGKIVKDDNQYTMDGEDEHKIFANYLGRKQPLTARTAKYQPLLDRVKARPGQLYVEYEMCLDYNYVPTAWKDWDKGWVRAAADVLIVNGEEAFYIDWKTGKFRPKDEQIRLTAAMTFEHFPAVKTFKGALVFHREQRMDVPLVIERWEKNEIWEEFLPTVNAMAKAKATGNFPKTPNPLCQFCPVTSCENWKPKPVR